MEGQMDRTTKLILAVIAAGLWANALVRPLPAAAQSGELNQIAIDIHNVAMGNCTNHVLCGH
jgi:hypothetical protein